MIAIQNTIFNAQEKANILAENSGLDLGEIVNVEEQQGIELTGRYEESRPRFMNYEF